MLAGSQFGRIKTLVPIRMPKLIATQVLELARRLDSGEKIELDIESKGVHPNFVKIPSD